MKKWSICTFFVTYGIYCFSQFNFAYNDSIPVKVNNVFIDFPWSGGLNYAQISEIDFDFDGDLDLFIFDRSKDNIRLFEQISVNGEKKYQFVHNAKQYFPPDLRYRVALVDYDQDGRNDIFTYGIGGVKVYKNTGTSQNGLSWMLISELLYSDYDGNYTNLYISSADIPAYVDLDFDGDIDILTFNIGGERLEYHKNHSVELYGHSDSLIFVLKNQCWGKFIEDPITSDIILDANNTPCNSGNVSNPELPKDSYSGIDKTKQTRHAGSTILAIDYDFSGVYDLIIGDVSLNSLSLLMNGGSAPNTNSKITSIDQNFPSNTTPVNVSVFPAAFYIDVDFDGVKDLLVCPNAKNASDNVKGVYFYKNIGTNSLPNFSFKKQNLFQENMIEVGTGSIPVFVDQNGDGEEDLLVGNFFRYKDQASKESVLSYYRNMGIGNMPSFTFIEADYLSLSNQSYGLRTVPAFGDIDADGDQDLFLGLEDGTLIFRENIAGAGNEFVFDTPVTNYMDNSGTVISTQNYCFPQLFDLNEDGLLDLILGKKTGELMYYENVGTANSPEFELKNDMLGGIDISPLLPDGYAAPHFFKFQDTIRLLLGGIDGKLRFYDQIENNLFPGDNFNLISDTYLNIDVEAYSSCWVNDIDQDGNLDLFVGGDLGGVFHLEHSENGTMNIEENKTENHTLKVFPNPTSDVLYISGNGLKNLNQCSIEILSVFGEQVYFSKDFSYSINIKNLEKGIYLLKIGTKITYKIIKI